MDVLTFETCWALNNEIKKQVTSVGLSLFNYQDDAWSNKHKISRMYEMCQSVPLKTTKVKTGLPARNVWSGLDTVQTAGEKGRFCMAGVRNNRHLSIAAAKCYEKLHYVISVNEPSRLPVQQNRSHSTLGVTETLAWFLPAGLRTYQHPCNILSTCKAPKGNWRHSDRNISLFPFWSG